jgi:general secretion pathway protein J
MSAGNSNDAARISMKPHPLTCSAHHGLQARVVAQADRMQSETPASPPALSRLHPKGTSCGARERVGTGRDEIKTSSCRMNKTVGFTLLELLIAITLLGFMLALLFGGMRLGARSWDAGELRSGHSTHLALVQGFLRRELSQVYPYRWKKKVNTELAFVGESSRLRFVAPIAARLGPGGLYLVSVEQAEDKDGKQLVMKRVIPDSDSGDFNALDEADAEKDVLAEQIESINFAYFGAETKDAEPQWLDKWDNPKSLPYLIRIRVKFSNGRDWPDLVVPPLIGNDTGCMWDSKTNRCISG